MADAPDWNELRFRLGVQRTDAQVRGHDWDVADVLEIVQEWVEEGT